MHPTDPETAREAAITATLALEQGGTNNAMGRIARRKLEALGVDMPETRTDRNVADAVDDAVMAAHAAGGVWENFWTEVIAEFDEWFASLPPVEPEWPEGHEPERAPIVVPPAYFALFKREVADEREVHFGLSHTRGEDPNGESARTVWAFDEILSQLPADDPGAGVEIMVPVHADCSARLLAWLRDSAWYPSPLTRATDGLISEDPNERHRVLDVARCYVSVLDQLDGLTARATA